MGSMTATPDTARPGPEVVGSAPARPTGINVGGVVFDRVTEQKANEHILASLDHGRGGWVITSNLDHLRRSRQDAKFSRMLREADLVVADGAPLIWASCLQGTPLPERVAGSSMAWSLTRAAAQAGRSVFLLGGDEGIADRAAEALRKRFSELRIAGTFYPPKGFEEDQDVMKAMRDALRVAKPDLVFVALGSPKQENLIRGLRAEFPETWWLGLGISLSFICGDVRRAPVWVQKIGLEWLHRLFQEPRRLARRYLIEGVPFGLLLVSSSLFKRFTYRREALVRMKGIQTGAAEESVPTWRRGDRQEDGKVEKHPWGE